MNSDMVKVIVSVITINLKEESLHHGKPKYAKLKSRLQTLGKFDVIIHWEPPKEEICPSSIAKYFFNLGYEVNSCAPSFTCKTLYSVKVPDIDFETVDENTASDIAEWLGMVSVSGDLEKDLNNYISTYETPLPNREIGQVKHLQWRGFFSTTKIKELIGKLENYNKIENKPWIAVYVQGFSDSPVAWGVEEHHYYTNGDNGYLLIFNENECLFCTQKCSRKRYK